MTKTLSVTYDGEVLRPDEPLDLTPNEHYQISVNGTNGVKNAISLTENAFTNELMGNSQAETNKPATDSSSTESTLTITFTSNEINELEALAERWGIALADLVKLKIKQMLIPTNEESKKLTEYILTKNVELYKRLA